MSIKVVDPKSLHYLKRERAIRAGDLIRIGDDQGSCLIENPFKFNEADDQPEIIINELNDFLIKIAPMLAFNLMSRRNRYDAKFDIIGSYNHSQTNSNIILASPSRTMPDEITFTGCVGDEILEHIPLVHRNKLTPPNIHIVQYKRDKTGKLAMNYGIAEKQNATLYHADLFNELMFWSKPENLKFIDHFIEPSDADSILKMLADATPHDVSVLGFIEEHINRSRKSAYRSKDDAVKMYKALESRLAEISKIDTRPDKFNVFFKKNLIGRLNQFDTTSWSFIPEPKQLVPFKIKQNNLLPSFFSNLMPEGIGEVKASEYLEFFQEEHSFIGDVCVRGLGSKKPPTSAVINTHLNDHVDSDRQFNGKLRNIGVLHATPAQSIALKEKGFNNVISGFADKVAVKLTVEDGLPIIEPTNDGDEFTHIFKFANEPEVANLEVCEWFGMKMAESIGIPVPAFALVPNKKSSCIKKSKPRDLLDDAFDALEVGTSLNKMLYTNESDEVAEPNYVIERFDIDDKDSSSISISEDFASILGIPPGLKYNPQYDDIVEIIREESTDWERDRHYVLNALTLNMLVNNCDMHAKNMSMLRVYDKDTQELLHNTLTPAYDIVAVDPHILGGRHRVSTKKHALEMSGDAQYSFKNLVKFSEVYLGFTEREARACITDACNKAMTASKSLLDCPPALLKEGNEPSASLESLCHFVEDNYDLYFSEHLTIDKSAIYDTPDEISEDFQISYL